MLEVKGAKKLEEKLKPDMLPLAVISNENCSIKLIRLVVDDVRVDVDRAYAQAITVLQEIAFEQAVFSYSYIL